MNYYIDKKKDEIVYIELNNLEGYNVKPKIKLEDTIGVSKIVFINPKFIEKIITKKIELQIKHLINNIIYLDTSSGDESGGASKTIMDADKLKVKIINDYIKYIGSDFASLSIKKIGLIIESAKMYIEQNKKHELRNKFYDDNYDYDSFYDNYYQDDYTDESEKGRKGR